MRRPTTRRGSIVTRPSDGARHPNLERDPARIIFLTPRAFASALKAGAEVPDEEFDRLAKGVTRPSRNTIETTTPIAVIRAALWLLTQGVPLRVLDAEAGLGKLCILGGLTTRAVFTGVERELPLVRAARAAAARFGAPRVSFLQGTISDVPLSLFDAIFLRDSQAAGDDPRAMRTWAKMAEARPGTRIVTYRGRSEPPGCRLISREGTSSGVLALFVKR